MVSKTIGVWSGALAGVLMVLFLFALRCRDSLELNDQELLETRIDVFLWGIMMLTGMLSALLALVLPDELKPLTGFVYWTFFVTIPLSEVWATRQRRALRTEGSNSVIR